MIRLLAFVQGAISLALAIFVLNMAAGCSHDPYCTTTIPYTSKSPNPTVYPCIPFTKTQGEKVVNSMNEIGGCSAPPNLDHVSGCSVFACAGAKLTCCSERSACLVVQAAESAKP